MREDGPPDVPRDEALPEGFKMTELGPLLEEWQVVRLGEVAEFVRGVSYRPDELLNHGSEGVPLLRATNIGDGTLDLSNVYYVPASRVRGPQYLRRFDIVIAMSSASKQAVGRLAQLRLDWTGCVGAFCGIIRPQPQRVYPEYLGYALQDRDFRAHVENYAAGTTIRNLSRERLLGFSLRLPPLVEQRAIARVLKTVQEAKEATGRVIAALKELKKSLMRHLFTYGPVPPEEAQRVPLRQSEIGPVPAHWQVVRFTNVAKTIRVPSVKRSEYRLIGKVPVIDQGREFIAGYTDLPPHEHPLPVIVFGDHTRVFKFVDFPFVAGADGTKVLVPNTRVVNAPFLFYALSNLDIPSRGYNRHFHLLREKHLPLPPLPEQQEIARILRAVDDKIAAEERRKAALETLFKSLLAQLMTGRLRVPLHAEVCHGS